MSISMEYCYSSLVVIRFLHKAALLVFLLIRQVLLFLMWPAASLSHQSTDQANSSHILKQAVRDSLHEATYEEMMMMTTTTSDDETVVTTATTTCAVCLSEVENKDRVWELRNCNHVFHKGCLDRWLDHDEHMTCPLCRAPLMTQAQSLGNASMVASTQPSWPVEQLLYLFGDDLLSTC